MPLGQREGVLLGTGSGLAAATVYFYRKKQTLPFKWAHFLAWPVLGTGIILACTPSPEQMASSVRKSGLADQRELTQQHELAAAQLAALRQTAEASRPGKPTIGRENSL